MVSFSPGCHYMFNFICKTQISVRKFTKVRNIVNAHAHVPFSARAEIPFRLHETFSDFQVPLAGLKIYYSSILKPG